MPIWVLVIDGEAYVASYLGEKGRWWRELLREKAGRLIAGRTAIDIVPHRVRSRATLEAMSAAFAKKYPTSGASLRAMQRPDVLRTALRLELV